jgi:hypothetical protein
MPRWLKGRVPMTAEQNKALVRRLVEEAVNPRNLDAGGGGTTSNSATRSAAPRATGSGDVITFRDDVREPAVE